MSERITETVSRYDGIQVIRRGKISFEGWELFSGFEPEAMSLWLQGLSEKVLEEVFTLTDNPLIDICLPYVYSGPEEGSDGPPFEYPITIDINLNTDDEGDPSPVTLRCRLDDMIMHQMTGLSMDGNYEGDYYDQFRAMQKSLRDLADKMEEMLSKHAGDLDPESDPG